MRREQADLRFKVASELGAPSRLKGRPAPTRASSLEKLDTDGKLDRIGSLQGRTDIVDDHFKELFTDPLHQDTPDWMWQWWPREDNPFQGLTARDWGRPPSFAIPPTHIVLGGRRWLWTSGRLWQSSDCRITGLRTQTRCAQNSSLQWSRKMASWRCVDSVQMQCSH